MNLTVFAQCLMVPAIHTNTSSNAGLCGLFLVAPLKLGCAIFSAYFRGWRVNLDPHTPHPAQYTSLCAYARLHIVEGALEGNHYDTEARFCVLLHEAAPSSTLIRSRWCVQEGQSDHVSSSIAVGYSDGALTRD